MRSRRVVGLLLMVIAMGLLSILLVLQRQQVPTPTSSVSPGAGSEAAAATAVATAGQTTADAASPVSSMSAATPSDAPDPLPPEGVALATVYADLVDRARAGDIQAARRLHRDVSQCRNQRLARLAAEDTRPVLLAELDDQTKAAMLGQRAWACARQQLCAGLPEALSQDPFQFLWSAASDGDLDARFWIASGMWMMGGPGGGYRDLLALQYATRMRGPALRWLREGVAAGHVTSFDLLASAYQLPEGSAQFNGEWLPHDPLLALAYRLAGEKPGAEIELDDADIDLYAALSDADQVFAQRLAQQLRAAHIRETADREQAWAQIEAAFRYQPDALTLQQRAPACLSAEAAARLQQLLGPAP